jgi:glutathione S-transferase
MLSLYVAPGASSMAPHIALHEIGVPFTPRPLSFARHETRAPAFRAINPEGEGPTLQAHHDRMLARPAVQRTIAIEAAIGYELPG